MYFKAADNATNVDYTYICKQLFYKQVSSWNWKITLKAVWP